MLEVPQKLNRNAKGVLDRGSPAETGRALVSYMCERIGIGSLAGLDVLDVGCGVRFSETFLNLHVPIGTYTGLDVSSEVIDFLGANVADPRFAYHHVDTVNAYYSPSGKPQTFNVPSLRDDATFDVVCMFSVITHQNPAEATKTFDFVRRRIRPDGHLFFSAFVHDGAEDYEERRPESPGHMSSYSLSAITQILRTAGWSVVSVVDPWPNDLRIMTSFLCRPV